MTAATSCRGRKRPRRDEQDTPPRPTLEDLEQEDRAQQQLTPGRAGPDQPQAAAQEEVTPGRAGPDQPQAAAHREMIPGRSAVKQQGHSSMTDFLVGAGQAAKVTQATAQHQRPADSPVNGKTCYSCARAAATCTMSGRLYSERCVHQWLPWSSGCPIKGTCLGVCLRPKLSYFGYQKDRAACTQLCCLFSSLSCHYTLACTSISHRP